MLASMEHKSEAGVAKRRGAQTTSTKFVANYVMCLHIHWSLFITLFVVLQMLENMGIVGIVHIVSLHISLCKRGMSWDPIVRFLNAVRLRMAGALNKQGRLLYFYGLGISTVLVVFS